MKFDHEFEILMLNHRFRRDVEIIKSDFNLNRVYQKKTSNCERSFKHQ